MGINRRDKDLETTGDFSQDYTSPSVSLDGCIFASAQVSGLSGIQGNVYVCISNDNVNFVNLPDMVVNLSGSDDSIFMDIKTNAKYLQVKFTHVSGSGTAGVNITVKEQ